jgi:hypothetical protein
VVDSQSVDYEKIQRSWIAQEINEALETFLQKKDQGLTYNK